MPSPATPIFQFARRLKELCSPGSMAATNPAALLSQRGAFGRSWFAGENAKGSGHYDNGRGPTRASTIRLASAKISSLLLFSRLEGLSANARIEPGELGSGPIKFLADQVIV